MSLNKRVLLLGSNGMAGHVINDVFSRVGNIVIETVARSGNSTYTMDLRDFSGLERILQSGNYDYVINASGLLNQYAEENPDEAILINSYLPHFIAKLSKILKFRLIHISTDCVFSGQKGGYLISDTKDGIGFYAQSKALGEVDYGGNLTFRTSIIGPEQKTDGIGLYDWFEKQTGVVNGYTEAFWSGVTTLTLAYAINEAINQELIGLYQLTNNKPISKYDLLCLIKDVFQRDDITVIKSEGKKVDKSLINERTDFDFDVPDYETMINELKKYLDS